ncbi:MAG TPA: sodium:calcium antiporter [Candidatus Polarisedimenticolaceae bacterium]|nr:sodium:calcium antiporter [Candidatus Polarisedimenticolaceae bacterium]
MEQLLPEGWFAGLPQWALLLITAASAGVLIKGADWLVEGAAGIAYHFGISQVIVGATVVSLGTTSPEAAVSVVAAWSGEPGLALGNAIGSVIADSGLIFGLGCLLVVLPADRFVLQRQGWVQFGSGSLLCGLCYATWAWAGDDATLPRWVGGMLLALLIVYLWVSVCWSRRHPQGEPFQVHEKEDVVAGLRRPVPMLIGVGLAGIVLVLLASRTMVLSVTELAEEHWHVPKLVIAATLVALGTSLPELVVGMTSILKGHNELLVGNVIGADILNVLFVVGAASLAAPLPLLEHGSSLPSILFLLHLPTMLLILVLFRLFIRSACHHRRFRRWHGVPLVLLYVAYTVAQYVLAR